MATAKMSLLNPGGTIQLPNTGTVVVGTDGMVIVDVRDIPAILQMGGSYIYSTAQYQPIIGTPRAASAGRIVSSTSFANGTLTIANQPDVPRQLNLVWTPGTTAITAGNVALTYRANDSTLQVDNLSPITAASTPATLTTSKGVISLTSAIVTGLTGGVTPGVQIDDTNSLSVSVSPGYQDFAITQAFENNAVQGTSAVASSAASYTPSTAPNASNTFGAFFTYNVPNT